MHVALLAIVAAVGLWWIVRSRSLFVISVRQGRRCTVVRGRVPPGMLASFRDVLDDTHAGYISASRTPNGARLTTRGNIPPDRTQRLRNILGLYPMSELTAKPIDKRNTVNDLHLVSRLLSLLTRRR